MSFDAPASSQAVTPVLPAPVPVGQVQGQKPRPKSQQTTILGNDALANAPSSTPGQSGGKTLLGS